MITEVAAKRYAEAVHLLATQDGKQEQWASALQALAVLFGDEQVQAFLQSPRVPDSEKLRLVENGLTGFDPLVLNLARLLLRRGRVSLGPQIAEAYQEILDEARGIFHATVTSAVPLSEDELRAVRDRLSELSGGQVTIEPHVDDRILGGLVVRLGDRLIDGSTRSRLQALKRQLAGARL